MMNLTDGRIDTADLRYSDSVEARELRLRAGDILFNRTNSLLHVGRTSLWRNELPVASFASYCVRYVCRETEIEPAYLVWYMNLPEVQTFIKRLATPAVQQVNVNPTQLRKLLKVSFPTDQNEQRCVIKLLDCADANVRETEAIISKLRQLKGGLLQDVLTRGVDEKGHLRSPDTHPEAFKDSPLGRIPKSWEAKTIDDIAIHVGSGATPTGGSEIYKKEGVLFLRSQNVTFDGLSLDDVAYIDWRTHRMMKRSEVYPNDLLLNITGASIGRCCSLPDGLGPANVNQHVCAIRVSEATRADAVYLSSVLSGHIGQSQIDRLNAGGNREGLNYQNIRALVVPWPLPDERQRISNVLEEAEGRVRAEKACRDKLRLQKQGLMHDLLTARVRV
jgi:type I restriction enzyme S subunit